MLNREKNIKELYDLKHINDSQKSVEYTNRLVNKIHSNVLFKNPLMNQFLYQFENLYIVMLESNLIIRNWFNYTKDKYDNNYTN
jgi:hypothetical protein